MGQLFACTESKGRLENNGIHVVRVHIYTIAEASQTVEDRSSIINFHTLQNVRMMSDYQICPCINRCVCQCCLVAVWCCLAVRSPVEIYDDQVCTLFFYCIDIICQLCPALTYLFVNGRYTDKSDLDAFDLKNRGIVVAKSRDPCIFQSGLCFGQTGGSVIFGVIVGKVDSLDRTVRECGNIGRISFINIALAG